MYYGLGKVMNMKKRIKELREDLALSQEKFGNLVGVTRSHIASMENGKALASKRVIKDINDLKDTEELVAFRIGIEPIYDEDDEFLYIDTDFHYRVFRDNKWLEKCGEKSIQSCSNITDIWEIDNFYYDSDIVFLAHDLTK